jgi:hypothetical protein
MSSSVECMADDSLRPGVDYTCDIRYDPFEFMAKYNKIYG